jgi:N-acetylneuraminic acid mutarotase
MVIYEKQLFVFAGYDGKIRFNDLHTVSVETFEWRKREPSGSLPITRFGHTASVYNDAMYVFGGWDGHDTLDDLYAYSFDANIWYEIRRISGSSPN